jgi:RNA polymerase primary sigma factor
MLLLSLIQPATGATGAAAHARSSKLAAGEELELATRLRERRQELLAIALLDPAGVRELERVAAEVDAGTLRLDAVVDEPDVLAAEARTRFERFCSQASALHASRDGARGEQVSHIETALPSAVALAGSLRLEWELVERVLQSSWLQKPHTDPSTKAAALPPALAEPAARARSDVASIVERFVTSHRGLVYNVANRYRGLGLSREDLTQEGNIGLLRAIEKFDAQRGASFTGYAMWWVRHAVRNAVAFQARTIRLPTSALARRFALDRASKRLAQELGRSPSRQELSGATGVAAESIADVLGMPKEPLSLDAPRSGENERPFGDSLSDPLAAGPHEATWAKELAAELRTLFGALTPREREVLSLRFGLNGSDEHTLEKIGSMLGVTRERIRQIVAAALEKLEHAIAQRELQP